MTDTKRTERTNENDRMVMAVVTMYVENGGPVTNRQVAERMGWSPGKVRAVGNRIFNDDNGWVRISPTKAEIEVRDRSYGTVTHRMAEAWQPTTLWVAKIAVEAMKGVR